MNDETKAAADAALVESMVRQLQDCVSVGDEMTLDHASLIDDAADWIAGEPARLAAEHARGVAVERARVVADLRRKADIVSVKRSMEATTTARALRERADRIERGEHDKEEAIPAVLIFGLPPVNP